MVFHFYWNPISNWVYMLTHFVNPHHVGVQTTPPIFKRFPNDLKVKTAQCYTKFVSRWLCTTICSFCLVILEISSNILGCFWKFQVFVTKLQLVCKYNSMNSFWVGTRWAVLSNSTILFCKTSVFLLHDMQIIMIKVPRQT